MLKVDLVQLEREQRVRIEEAIPADAPIWEDSGLRWLGPVEVDVEAQMVGADVWVRGRFSGTLLLECRRCTKELKSPVEDELSLFFRSGASPAEAEDEEVYPLTERDRDLDLSEPIRESILLSVPEFGLCDAACRGLCPRCGANLSEGDCGCVVEDEDPRWAALRNLKTD